MRKWSVFWQKPWTNPSSKCRYSLTLLELHFSCLKSILSIQNIKKCFFLASFAPKNKTYEKRSIFWQKPWTPLQNVDFFDFAWSSVLRSNKLYFLSRTSKNLSFWLFLLKKRHIRKRSIFWQKPWTNPFAKCRYFLTLLEIHFSGLKSILFYPEYQKMFLYGFFAKKKHIRKRSIF